jgi:hypothetical protein
VRQHDCPAPISKVIYREAAAGRAAPTPDAVRGPRVDRLRLRTHVRRVLSRSGFGCHGRVMGRPAPIFDLMRGPEGFPCPSSDLADRPARCPALASNGIGGGPPAPNRIILRAPATCPASSFMRSRAPGSVQFRVRISGAGEPRGLSRQPFVNDLPAKVPLSDGPRDPGSPLRDHEARRRGFPRSHGPVEEEFAPRRLIIG